MKRGFDMNRLSNVLRGAEGNRMAFWCPGCDEAHAIRIGSDGWGFNGDFDKPTFTPSILVRRGHHSDGNPECWCTYNKAHPKNPAPFTCGMCHSYVIDGRIQFLADSTHALAGQTVDLPEFEE